MSQGVTYAQSSHSWGTVDQILGLIRKIEMRLRLWVELCPPKNSIGVIPTSIHECELIWK
jgi:hypothetical protein